MKIRIRLPSSISRYTALRTSTKVQEFVDDIMMWAMEVEIDIAVYGFCEQKEERFVVFTIEEKDAFIFALKWGALMHKGLKNAALS